MVLESMKLGCVQGTHFGLRTGSYMRAVQAGFRMFPRESSVGGGEYGSSPTSGTCFPCSGACEPLNVYKSPLMGPYGGPFLSVAVALWRLLLLTWTAVLLRTSSWPGVLGTA